MPEKAGPNNSQSFGSLLVEPPSPRSDAAEYEEDSLASESTQSLSSALGDFQNDYIDNDQDLLGLTDQSIHSASVTGAGAEDDGQAVGENVPDDSQSDHLVDVHEDNTVEVRESVKDTDNRVEENPKADERTSRPQK